MSKTAKLIFAGVDGGNTSIKLQLENGKTITYENIFCDRNSTQMEKEYLRNGTKVANKNNMANFLDVSFTSGDDTESFIFGEQTKDYLTKIKERTNKYKSKDMQLVRNSLVALVNTIVSQMDKKDWKEELNLDVALSTGLPFHEYETKGAIEEYSKKFLGKHTIKFLNPSYPIRTVNLNVKDIDVDIEGFAALRQTLVEKEITEKPLNELKNKAACMVDIGCYSIDIVGGRFKIDIDEDGEECFDFNTLEELCKGITQGVGSATDNTILALKEKYSKELGQHGKITRQAVFNATQNETNKNHIEGTTFNVEPYFSEECAKLGKMAGSQVAEMIDASGYRNNLLKIYVAGGGAKDSIIMKNFKKALDEYGYGEELIDIAEDPTYANARGYYNIAVNTLGEE